MKKVDVLIKGNLCCSAAGGGLIACRQIPSDYDVSGAVIITGDTRFTSIDIKDKTVLVLGHITALEKGGNNGSL